MSDATQEFGPDDPLHRRVGDLVDGRYRLEEAIGGGVTATTWRAHDPVLGRDVAVKLWRDGSADAHRSQQEELGAARLLDPNLSELLDAGSHDGRPFLVREIATEHSAVAALPRSTAVASPATAETAATPAHGVPAIRTRRGGDRVVITAVGAIVAAVVLVGVGLMARPDASDPPDNGPATSVLMPSHVASFDPQGDGQENPGEVGALVDGDPRTSWSSDRYNSRKFGNLKPGLGLAMTLTPPRKLSYMEVASGTAGWDAQVHVADAAGDDLADWGPPVDRVTGSRASERFDLGGRTVGAVLIWFTDLGPESNRLTITEIAIHGAA